MKTVSVRNDSIGGIVEGVIWGSTQASAAGRRQRGRDKAWLLLTELQGRRDHLPTSQSSFSKDTTGPLDPARWSLGDGSK